ncbi:MAG: sodium ion-translocating decarboxylase subunit beta, partial [Clostridia bacterium]|nr:sodium ion-translocating decarboxylase subunit beta [Clostridia bacterium]
MFSNLWESSGLANGSWQNYVMILVSFVLMYLAIVKKFEPLLLLPIAFGMFLINLPGAYNILWGTYEDVALSSEEFMGLGLAIPEGWQFLDGQLVKWATETGAWQAITGQEFSALALELPEGIYFENGYLMKEVAHTYENVSNRGLLWYLFFGVQNVIYPP